MPAVGRVTVSLRRSTGADIDAEVSSRARDLARRGDRNARQSGRIADRGPVVLRRVLGRRLVVLLGRGGVLLRLFAGPGCGRAELAAQLALELRQQLDLDPLRAILDRDDEPQRLAAVHDDLDQ